MGDLGLSLSETSWPQVMAAVLNEGHVSPHCGLLQGIEVSQAAEYSRRVLSFCGLFTPFLYQATPQ